MGLIDDLENADSKFYFNMETQTVEKGLVSDWNHRMGPYDSEEEARDAMKLANERTKNWDREDDEWNG